MVSIEALLGPFTWLAVVGFLASLIVHVRALAGMASPFGAATWFLHIGVFVVWFPTVLVMQRLSKGAKQADVWKATLRGCPAWMKTGAYAVFVYGFVNFFLFLAQTGSYPKNQVPDLVEYRGFSGHWMIFYYIAAATLYSATRLGNLAQPKCPHGHEVSPFAKYCEACGAPIAPPGL